MLWSPLPRQKIFMSRPEWEALYGGAAGGGKSEALVMEALRQVHVPHYRALILRKTNPQLAELIDKSHRYYSRAFPGARYNATARTWTFPSGAKITFGSMQYTKDRTRYQGLAYDFIAFDELTHFTFDEYSYLFSRCRPSGPGTRCYIRATANPGGVGHAWVKERFITAAPPMTPIVDELTWTDAAGVTHAGTRSRIFVPACVTDNTALLSADPGYVLSLAALPAAERAALLDGNWDTFTGQVFTEWRNDPAGYATGQGSHVVTPFAVPPSWPIWCSLDWGYARPYAVSWYAVSPAGRLYNIRELYGCTGTPNEGVREEPAAVARAIAAIEADDPNIAGHRISRVGDPAIWQCDGTESIGALLERSRLYFERGDHARLSGKMQVHHRLSPGADGVARLLVFSTCRHMIRTLPALTYSGVNVEDVDTACEDHLYDALRYVCMKNPIFPRAPVALRRPPTPFEE